jgi:hypothetical protein
MNDEPLCVVKFVTFTLSPGGKWDVQLWADHSYVVSGKVYKLTIPVPAELIPAEIPARIEPT